MKKKRKKKRITLISIYYVPDTVLHALYTLSPSILTMLGDRYRQKSYSFQEVEPERSPIKKAIHVTTNCYIRNY